MSEPAHTPDWRLAGNGGPCPECDGRGFVQVEGSTWSIAKREPVTFRLACYFCDGRGRVSKPVTQIYAEAVKKRNEVSP